MNHKLLYDIDSTHKEYDFIKKWESDPALPLLVNEPGVCMTPLTKVISYGWKNAVVLLINNGADVNQKDPFGDTPLSDCVRRNNIPMMKLLLNYGADIKAHDWIILNGRFIGNIEIIDFVISLNSGYIEPIINKVLNGNTWRSTEIVRFLHSERIRVAATVFIDLPQYIILWITDWLPGSEYLKEYEKVEFIEQIQCSIREVMDKKIEKTLA